MQEHLDQVYTFEQLSFRIRENRLYYMMAVSVLVFIVFKLACLFVIFFEAKKYGLLVKAINSGIYLCLALLLLVTFISLIRLIRQHHTAQYLKLRRSLFLYFSGTLLQCAVLFYSNLAAVLVQSLSEAYSKNSSDLTDLCF
jgi:hypothetical protein